MYILYYIIDIPICTPILRLLQYFSNILFYHKLRHIIHYNTILCTVDTKLKRYIHSPYISNCNTCLILILKIIGDFFFV